MRSKTLLLVSLLAMFLGPATAGQTVLSTNVTETKWVEANDPVLQRIAVTPRTDWAYVQVKKMEDPKLGNFRVYQGYRISVDGDLHRSRIEFSAEEWMNRNNFTLNEMAVFSGPGLRYSGVHRSGNGLASSFQPEDRLFIGGTHKVGEMTYTARSAESCGLHHVSGKNLTAVEKCTIQKSWGTNEGGLQTDTEKKFIDGSISKTFEIIRDRELLLIAGPVVLILILVLLVLYMKRGNSDVDRIKEITEEVIQEMENGELKKDENLLKDLEEANELAYNSEYEKANEKIEEVLDELKDIER